MAYVVWYRIRGGKGAITSNRLAYYDDGGKAQTVVRFDFFPQRGDTTWRIRVLLLPDVVTPEEVAMDAESIALVTLHNVRFSSSLFLMVCLLLSRSLGGAYDCFVMCKTVVSALWSLDLVHLQIPCVAGGHGVQLLLPSSFDPRRTMVRKLLHVEKGDFLIVYMEMDGYQLYLKMGGGNGNLFDLCLLISGTVPVWILEPVPDATSNVSLYDFLFDLFQRKGWVVQMAPKL